MIEPKEEKRIFAMSGMIAIAAFLLIVSIIAAMLDHKEDAPTKDSGRGSKAPKEEKKNREAPLYTVKSGDTLSEISKHSGLTVERIKEINGLKGNNLSIGQKLRLEGDDGKKTEGTENEEGQDVYTVKKGDSLYKIALDTKVSVKEIKKLNDLKDNNLSIGQKLKLK